MNQYKAEFELLRCKFNQEETHFYNDPRILPCCSNVACLECIINELSNGHLKCGYCNKTNAINNILELKSNNNIVDQINACSEEIIKEIEAKFKQNAIESKEKRIQIINEICQKAKIDIDSRINLVNNHLVILQKDLLDSLKIIKEKATLEYNKSNKEANVKGDDYEKFSIDMKKMLEDFKSHKEKVDLDIYKCQLYINDLEHFDDKFRYLYRKIKFESSDWQPDEAFIFPCFEIFNKSAEKTIIEEV